MVQSGESKNQKGHSIMSKTVGITSAIAARMVLERKIELKGVISPIHSEIYEPLLQELEREGIKMLEESSSEEGRERMKRGE
jgi:saccharopine dehydrogenase-like NADP-dependent oxidoreductase